MPAQQDALGCRRELFAVSRQKRAVANDPDRLKKYLARFELSFEACQSR
jgi:transcriptional regulatory protein RtcR